MKTFARIAMVISLMMLAGVLFYFWALAFRPDTAEFWRTLSIENGAWPVPTWVKVWGPVFSLNVVLALGYCYWAVWQVLSADGEALFPAMALALRRLSNGLIYFWISYGLAAGLMPTLAAASVVGIDSPAMVGNWNPFGINSVFLVLGLAFRPLAKAMEKAAKIHAINRSFV
ncbi:MAG: hypothetical protein JNK34_02625 [Tabrizicola sp.]|nr:hypothetical protein [Tabrizicola sp.]